MLNSGVVCAEAIGQCRVLLPSFSTLVFEQGDLEVTVLACSWLASPRDVPGSAPSTRVIDEHNWVFTWVLGT